MATFKHISSKNADYGDAEKYLTYEHDEFTMKPVLDENGNLIPRSNYRFSTLNCGGEDFAVACMRANLRYGKNRSKGEVKSHHYIISFDPRDGPDHGLTVDQAQALGEQFCREQFPGHQAIVCTHDDGHNHSGNIHVHIVINSLRIEDVPFLPYMDRPADTKAGCKHRCTDAAMKYFRSEVMELCHSAGLYQIDLLHGSGERITEEEYWAKRKGQAKIDEENAVRAETGQPRIHTRFETEKEQLRRDLRWAISQARSFEEYAALLLQRGITVKESRGRLSYLTPGRTKPITARRLGDDFDKAAVLSTLEANAKKPIRQSPPVTTHRTDTRSQEKPPPQVQRMVDIAAKRAEGKGKGYENWAKIFNLKQMAASVHLYQEYGFNSQEELDSVVSRERSAFNATRAALKSVEAELAGKKELRTHVSTYMKLKPLREEYRRLKPDKARQRFRQAHETDFILLDAAADYFKAHGIQKVPSRKSLQSEIEALISRKNALYNDYYTQKTRLRELETMQRNIDTILREGSQRAVERDQSR